MANLPFRFRAEGADRVQRDIRQIGQAGERANARIRRSGDGAARGFRMVGESAGVAGRQIGQLRGEARSLQGGLGGLAGQARNVAAGLGLLAGGAAAVRGLRESVDSAADFQTSLTEIEKTTGATGAALAALGGDIETLALRLGRGAAELGEITQAAGRVGIRGAQNLALFTEQIALLEETTDLVGEQATISIGRLLAVTGEAPSRVAPLAGAISLVGDTVAGLESEVVDLATRIGQAAGRFDIASTEAVGLAGALVNVGIRAEEGGTQVGKAFEAIAAAIGGGGEQAQRLADLTGQSVAQMEASFRDDALAAILDVIEAIGEMDTLAQGGVLEDLNIGGARGTRVFGTLASAIDDARRTLALANDQSRTAGRLQAEFANRVDDANTQLGRAQQGAEFIGRTLGAELLPSVTANAQAFADWAGALDRSDIAGALDLAGAAAGLLAGVLAGRLASAVAESAAGSARKAVTDRAAAAAEREAAAAALARAQATRQAAAANVAAFARSGAAIDQIRAQSSRLQQAQRDLTAAQLRHTAAMRNASVAGRALRGVMATLGGPVGIAITAASAFLLLRDNTSAAEDAQRLLADSGRTLEDALQGQLEALEGNAAATEQLRREQAALAAQQQENRLSEIADVQDEARGDIGGALQRAVQSAVAFQQTTVAQQIDALETLFEAGEIGAADLLSRLREMAAGGNEAAASVASAIGGSEGPVAALIAMQDEARRAREELARIAQQPLIEQFLAGGALRVTAADIDESPAGAANGVRGAGGSAGNDGGAAARRARQFSEATAAAREQLALAQREATLREAILNFDQKLAAVRREFPDLSREQAQQVAAQQVAAEKLAAQTDARAKAERAAQKAIADAVKESQRAADFAQLELEGREEELFIQQRILAIRDEIGRDLLPEDRRLLEDTLRIEFRRQQAIEDQAEARRRELQRQREAQRAAEESFRETSALFRELFFDGVGSIWDRFKRLGEGVIADLAASFILGVQPGGSSALGLLGSLGPLLGGAPAGGAAGGGGLGGAAGLFGSLGLADFVSGGGLLGSLGITGGLAGIGGAINSFGASAFGLAPNATEAVINGALGQGSTATLGGVLGGAGLGFAGGQLFGSIFGSGGTGATIGGSIGGALGALGSIGGPLGALGGVAIGGLLGSLLGKTPVAQAVVGTGGVGGLDQRGGADQAVAQQLGQAVLDQIGGIASQLGLQVAENIQIGQIGTRKDEFLFSPTVTEKLKQFGKDSRDPDFQSFDDPEEAARAAVLSALRGGALVGLSDASREVLATATNLEQAVAKIAEIEGREVALDNFAAGLSDAIRQIEDPLDFAVSAFADAQRAFVETAIDSGADLEDAARLFALREDKFVDQTFGQAISTLDGLIARVQGTSLGGIAAGEQFDFLQRQFADFAGDIREGERIDAQAFASLSQDLLGLGGDLFGGSQRFIDLRSQVLDLAEQARRNAAEAGELPEFAALRGEIERLREEQAKSNEDSARRDEERQQTLEDILATLRSGSTPVAVGGGGVGGLDAFAGGATLRSLF